MPHGTRDWGLVGPKETTFGLDDLGEQAVRLGSSHLWDRRGDVLLQEDFRNGRATLKDLDISTETSVSLWAGNAAHGSYSLRLHSGIKADAGAIGLIWQRGLPKASAIGLEYTFSIADGMTDWQWWIYRHGPTYFQDGLISWRLGSSQLQYRDDGGGMVPFAWDVTSFPYDAPNHTGKMVVDFAQGRYSRFILDGVTYDLGAIPCIRVDPIAALSVYVNILMLASVDDDVDGYVDNVIITQNEP
ncbi:unnamed protein product [marine sediment metagenome]|uniref:Uncharacterized protein n=1 Tax=marine sediment metagenome TaxID=412755 RepID=X1QVT1_9ZZZZ